MIKHPAGQRFHYSNLGYGLLGQVVATLRGRPWADCLVEEVLQPLAMRRTTLRPQAPSAPGLAVHPWADLVHSEPEHDAGAMAPAGQLWSTLGDLAKWATFLAGGADGASVLSADSLEEMRAPIHAETSPEGWSGYGLALSVRLIEGGALVGHGGLGLVPLSDSMVRASRFRREPDGTWRGLDGYYAGETMRAVRCADGSVSHLAVATFVFTRRPYDPGADIPGGVDPRGWHSS